MKTKLYLYTFVAALGGLLFGFDTAVINGAIPFFTEHFGLSDAMKGWAVSSALIGCVVGALSVGRPGDYFGRRQVLRVLALLFLISAIGTGFAWNFHSFIIFRVIGGLARFVSFIYCRNSTGRISWPFGGYLSAGYCFGDSRCFFLRLSVAEYGS